MRRSIVFVYLWYRSIYYKRRRNPDHAAEIHEQNKPKQCTERRAESWNALLLSSLECLKLLEKVLVQNQHDAALDTGPDGAWPNAAEPANKAFGLVDHAKSGDNG